MARRPRFVAVLLGVLVALTACGGQEQLTGAVLTTPYVVPHTALTDTAGADYSLADDTDKRLTLVFFGYTNCPDVCSVVMASLASAMTKLDAQDRKQVDVVFVTTDPARDTAPVLRDYLDRFDPSFIGLTGRLATITDIGHSLAIAVEKGEKLPSGGFDITHGTSVLGIDGQDQVPIVWTQGTSAAQIADDVHQLLAT